MGANAASSTIEMVVLLTTARRAAAGNACVCTPRSSSWSRMWLVSLLTLLLVLCMLSADRVTAAPIPRPGFESLTALSDEVTHVSSSRAPSLHQELDLINDFGSRATSAAHTLATPPTTPTHNSGPVRAPLGVVRSHSDPSLSRSGFTVDFGTTRRRLDLNQDHIDQHDENMRILKAELRQRISLSSNRATRRLGTEAPPNTPESVHEKRRSSSS